MPTNPFHRRDFLIGSSALAVGAIAQLASKGAWAQGKPQPSFEISLAEWSLHKTLYDEKLSNLEFPQTAKTLYGIGAVEYVNAFFKDKALDQDYLTELNQRATDHGVKNLLIMVDGEGELGAADLAERTRNVENHYQWVEAARMLGCHSIRVNAASTGTYDEQQKLATDGLRRLCEFAQERDMNVIVENHGGWSSNGAWLAKVIRDVDLPNCGTLPDFGNFRVRDDEWYDRYQGVAELMPYAKAVSAKSHEFDEEGNEVNSDYRRLLTIVLDAGYHGYIGIEYEGSTLSEHDGIIATKRLLERVRDELGNRQ